MHERQLRVVDMLLEHIVLKVLALFLAIIINLNALLTFENTRLSDLGAMILHSYFERIILINPVNPVMDSPEKLILLKNYIIYFADIKLTTFAFPYAISVNINNKKLNFRGH